MNQWTKDFLAGSISGILGTAVGHPLDTIKCRIQVNSTVYSNTFDSLFKIVRQEKLAGLFKGLVPPVLKYYRMFRYLETNSNYSSGAKYFLGGLWAGFVNVLIITPTELLKCRQQLEIDKFKSLVEVGKEVYLSEGFKGFYRGFCVTFNRDFVSSGIYFYVYYKLKSHWEEKRSISSFKLMLAGGVSGVLTWLSTYPFDIFKTMIQTNKEKRKMSQWEAFQTLARKSEGLVRSLTKGLSPTLFRAFLVNGVIFYTNDQCHNFLNKL